MARPIAAGEGSFESGGGALSTKLLGEDSSLYAITERVEVTYMGELLGSPRTRTFCSVMLMVYLYGDLAVYAVVIPTTLSGVARLPFDEGSGSAGAPASRPAAYLQPAEGRGWVRRGGGRRSADVHGLPGVLRRADAAHLLPRLPCEPPHPHSPTLAATDGHERNATEKSAYLQYTTCFVRNSAFFTMVTVMLWHLRTDGAGIPPDAHLERTPLKLADPSEFAELYGVVRRRLGPACLCTAVLTERGVQCIYAFMCHHSLPSIISPIRDKSVVVKIFLVDYICILIA